MIRNLAVEHPNYNKALEVLALLPLYPRTAALAGIAKDLGEKGQGTIKLTLTVLRHWGYELYSNMGDTREGRVHVAAVLPQSWERARRVAENYLCAQYNEQGVPRRKAQLTGSV